MNPTEFLIVLQTHTNSSNQDYLKKDRYCVYNKSDVTLTCVRSLIHTINHGVYNNTNIKFKLYILDDHSDHNSVLSLYNMLNGAIFEHHVVSLDTYGIMPSILACYEYGKKYGKDYVYFAQDDYLYEEDAISQMIAAYDMFATNIGNHIGIYPFNDPYRYAGVNMLEQMRIVHGPDRHWRTNNHTASCFMVHNTLLVDNWDLFYAMGTHPVTEDMEKNTINKLWQQRGYFLFTPIRSLALHMQYETERDPYFDWETLWGNNSMEVGMYDQNTYFDWETLWGNNSMEVGMYDQNTLSIGADYSDIVFTDTKQLINTLTHCFTNRYTLVCISNVLEQINFNDLPRVLLELYRIIEKKEGEIHIIVPDLQSVDVNNMTIKDLHIIYGDVTHFNSGYTQSMIEQCCAIFNFNIKQCVRYNNQLELILRKNQYDNI